MDGAFVVVVSFTAGGVRRLHNEVMALFDAASMSSSSTFSVSLLPSVLLRSIEAVLHQLLDHYSLTANLPGWAHPSRFTRRAVLVGGSRQRLISLLIACHVSEDRLYNYVRLSRRPNCGIDTYVMFRFSRQVAKNPRKLLLAQSTPEKTLTFDT